MRSTSIIAAWMALMWERSARLVWPALLAPGLFLVVALFGVWERLGDPWRLGAAIVALAWAAGFGLRGLISGAWPGGAAARRRLEEDAGLADRPFEALEDSPARPGPAADELWRAHRDRMSARLRGARARRPKAAYAAADPAGLRIVLTLLAIAGFAAAGGDAGARLGLSLAPRLIEGGADAAVLEAWIDPPAYTARAPVFLDAAGGSAKAPVGSKVVVRLAGVRHAPRLVVRDETGATKLKPELSDGGAHMYAFDLVDDVEAKLTAGRPRRWSIDAQPDLAPFIAFAEPPSVGEKQVLAFKVEADDDYGVVDVLLRVEWREDETAIAPGEHALDLPQVRSMKNEAAALDLTEHPWAGRKVALRLVARDAAGGEGASAAVEMTLPERVFAEPLAKAIHEQRRTLVRLDSDYAPASSSEPERARFAEDAAAIPPVLVERARDRIDRAPEAVDRVHAAVSALALEPESFAADVVVQLGLDYLAERLLLARSRSDLEDLPGVFWDLARRAEGGDLADAERAMREAQQALARALARGAPQEEIDQLTQRYRQAVNSYLELLRQEAIAAGRVETMAGGAGGEMGVDQLQEMLKTLEELAQTGSREDARRLLNALNEMLQNLEMSVAMGAGGEGSPLDSDNQELREALEDLADLIGEQRELMDDTLDRREGRSDDSQGADSPGADSPGDGDPTRDGEQPGGPQARPQGQGLQGQGSQGSGSQGAGTEAPGAGDLAQRQAELAQALADLAERLAEGRGAGASDAPPGEAPGQTPGQAPGQAYELGDDGRFMDYAEQALRGGDLSGAIDAQGEAIERLREAAEALAREAIERGGGAQQAGRQAGEGGADQPSRSADPFGRTSGGLGIGDDIEVPTEMERRRARDILDMLRDRLGDTERPEDEREYIERLLDSL